MKKIYTVIALFVIIHLPLSCGFNCEDSCCGQTFKEQYSKIAALDSEVTTYQDKATILIYVSDIELVENPGTAFNSSGFHFSFINSAYGCDPAPPNPTQKLQSITIASEDTVYASGKVFVPGRELTELFYVANSAERMNQTMDQFIEKQNNNLHLFGTWETTVYLQLIQQPDSTINQKLLFTFSFDDSSEIKIETEPFM